MPILGINDAAGKRYINEERQAELITTHIQPWLRSPEATPLPMPLKSSVRYS